MIDITAIILTRNEEDYLGDCIDSIKSFCKRIVVVDSFSEDKTVEIAKSKGAEVFAHEFVNYAKQYKYAVDIANVKTKWILRIDADERFSKESAEEIERLCIENENTNINGFVIRFVNIFMGKKMYHGGLYPFQKLAVYKTGLGDIEDRNMDEHIILSEGTYAYCKKDGFHYAYRGLDFFVNKHNWYSSREARDYFENKAVSEKNSSKMTSIKMNRYYRLPIFFRAKMYYLYRYYWLRGFLDGTEGRIIAFMHAYWYRFLVDAKIYEYEHGQSDFRKLGPLK